MSSLDLPRSAKLDALMRKAARGAILDDASFDAIYPEAVRAPSAIHWTPFAVAARALDLLRVDERSKVLDVGSGAGKFCLIGALRTRGQFFGVEQREPLVQVSQRIAEQYSVERVHFIAENVEDTDWSGYDAIYIYNPFAECLLPRDEQIAFEAELTRARFDYLVATVYERLAFAPRGTRVVTFHGLGGPMPPGYRPVTTEQLEGGLLESWIRDDHSSYQGDGFEPFEDYRGRRSQRA